MAKVRLTATIKYTIEYDTSDWPNYFTSLSDLDVFKDPTTGEILPYLIVPEMYNIDADEFGYCGVVGEFNADAEFIGKDLFIIDDSPTNLYPDPPF